MLLRDLEGRADFFEELLVCVRADLRGADRFGAALLEVESLADFVFEAVLLRGVFLPGLFGVT